MPALDPQQTAADLRLAVGRFVRRVRAEASTLPPSQMAVLGRLDREGPLTIADLAAAERVSHQSMTRLVATLSAARLVKAGPRAPDRRRKLLAISAAGHRALTAQRTHRTDHLAAAIATQLTDDEHHTLAQAAALLDRLATAA
jgi:DNA-binding MarR family transcriptional regulator